VFVAALAACGDGDSGTTAVFDLDGNITEPATFWDHPFPSDLRLEDDGTPDLTGFPNPRAIPIIDDLLATADSRPGFAMMPVGFIRFDAELAPRDPADVILPSADAPIVLIDVDPDSPDRGRLIPTIALTLVIDDYVPGYVLAMAPRPGFVLEGDNTYAFAVMRSANDVAGELLGVNGAVRDLVNGRTPDGAWGDAARAVFEPLGDALDIAGIERDEVAAATVFTTGDVVKELEQLSSAVRAAHSVTIDDLAIDPDDGADHARFCELTGSVTNPQFQRGDPPFNSEGQFEFGDDGLPIVQRTSVSPLTLTLPVGEMPPNGYPLMVYFHGSGGKSFQVVDRGKQHTVDGEPTKGEGPAYVVAEHGIATVSSALPINPERVPGVSDIAYINFNNLKAAPDLFRQGVFEQRMLIDALAELEIDPAVVAGCSGMSLPVGETMYKLDVTKFAGAGQSMGGMYTNMVGAVDPRLKIAVPTGAGGFWNSMLLEIEILEGVRDLLAILIGTPEPDMTFMHPGLQLLAMGWERNDPFVFMPRLGRRPLEGHPARPVYEPVGMGDVYFSINVYDAAALSYGHRQAGDEVWPSMQPALALDDLDGYIDYPIANNLESDGGEPYTGAVVQYEGDGIRNAHYIYSQLDEVKYQYGCFLATFFERGVATVPAPAPLGTPCP
jgi:hypothetical protein